MSGLPEPASLRPGDRLDRYELVCPLAYGGMAAVWLARQRATSDKLGIERLVVVKTILPQYASHEQFQRMFLDEARVASAIEHPNVARTLDVGDRDDILYIVMEWVDGESLSKLHQTVEKNGAEMPIGVVLRLAADCCAGLHAAHELRDKSGARLQVVHRDVSPQNILVSTGGVAKVIDFGVAKARDRAAVSTSAGQLKGKVRYMSPEQALGHNVDRRADVWSMGAVIYELLAGVPPYDGPNEVATLHALTSGAPPAPLPHHVPDDVWHVVERALAYDPDKRFLTALEMQEALENAMMSVGMPTTTAHVAGFFEAHLGPKVAARRKAIENAIAQADARPLRGSMSGPVAPLEAPSHPSTATLGSAAVEWTPTQVGARRRRAGAFMLLGALGATALVALAGLAAARRAQSRAQSAPIAPPAAASAPPTASEFEPPYEPEISSTPLAPSRSGDPTITVPVGALPVAQPPSAAAPAPPRPRARTYAPRTSTTPASSGKKRDYGF